MMKLDDLLGVAGGEPLKKFVWGEGVVKNINMMLTIERHVTSEITGDEALRIVRSLPGQALLEMLTIRINPADGSAITQSPTNQPIPVVVPQANPLTKDPRTLFSLVIGVAMVLVALMMAVSMTTNSIHTGQHDPNALKDVMQVMTEAAKVVNESSSSTAPTTTPETVSEEPVHPDETTPQQ